MSCCRTCTTLQERSTNAVQQSICRTVCDVESMDFSYVWRSKCDHTTRIPLCCKTPLERTLGELPCLCSAQNPNMLVSLSVSRGVQAICAEGSTSANSDGDGDDREKARTAWWGHFCEIMRQRNEKGLQSTTRNDLRRAKTKRHNVPDSRRALHMHVLERDFGIAQLAMQHDCATCASMLRDAVTAAQSRFLATGFASTLCTYQLQAPPPPPPPETTGDLTASLWPRVGNLTTRWVSGVGHIDRRQSALRSPRVQGGVIWPFRLSPGGDLGSIWPPHWSNPHHLPGGGGGTLGHAIDRCISHNGSWPLIATNPQPSKKKKKKKKKKRLSFLKKKNRKTL